MLFLVMPVFALANAGVSFAGGFLEALTHPVAIGIALGLAIGKPVGITLMPLVVARSMGAVLPGRLLNIVGVGLIAGIGFTMSLFIGALAFPSDPDLQVPVRVGVYAGSFAAALAGIAILAAVLPRRSATATTPETDPARPFIAEEAEYMDGDPRVGQWARLSGPSGAQEPRPTQPHNATRLTLGLGSTNPKVRNSSRRSPTELQDPGGVLLDCRSLRRLGCTC